MRHERAGDRLTGTGDGGVVCGGGADGGDLLLQLPGCLVFGERRLRFLHTAGHANHHVCIHDSATNGVFTGDSFGIAYPRLQTRGLRRSFGSRLVIDQLDLAVPKGCVYGFLGRNGAGKTTCMRSIFGLVQLDGGTMHWEGKPIDREARYRFGYMPEERGLYPRMTVDSQMQYFGQLRGLSAIEAKRQGERWMERLDLTDRRESTAGIAAL